MLIRQLKSKLRDLLGEYHKDPGATADKIQVLVSLEGKSLLQLLYETGLAYELGHLPRNEIIEQENLDIFIRDRLTRLRVMGTSVESNELLQQAYELIDAALDLESSRLPKESNVLGTPWASDNESE